MSVYCPHCGKDNPGIAKYCENCGKEIIITPEIKNYPNQFPEEGYKNKTKSNLIKRIDWFWVVFGIVLISIVLVIIIFNYDILFKPLGGGY